MPAQWVPIEGHTPVHRPEYVRRGALPTNRMDLTVVVPPDLMGVQVLRGVTWLGTGLRLLKYLRNAGLSINVEGCDSTTRSLAVSGSVASIEQAFRPRLAAFVGTGTQQGRGGVAPTQTPSVPARWAPLVEAVLGLDTRPMFDPAPVVPSMVHERGGPVLLGSMIGHVIGVISLGAPVDVAALQRMGMNGPAVISRYIADPVPDPDGARALQRSIEVIRRADPLATVVVYHAPNSERGMFEALRAASTDAQASPEAQVVSGRPAPGILLLGSTALPDSMTRSGQAVITNLLRFIQATRVRVTVQAAGPTPPGAPRPGPQGPTTPGI